MFGIGKIPLILCGVLAVALGVTGFLLKNALEAKGAAQAANEANIAAAELQIERQAASIARLEERRAEDQRIMATLRDDVAEAEAALESERARLEQWRAKLRSRTLDKPQVTERAATIAMRRKACELWRATGGEGECPK